jgi:fucose permease
MTVLAELGAASLWIMYGWLACAIAASYVTERKSYSIKLGLVLGLLLLPVGIIIALALPARDGSIWKAVGPFGRGKPGEPPKAA